MIPTLNSNGTGGGDKGRSIKFLYSYGGRILPRHSDGELRYFGGHTRILAVDCSTTFAELMVKFGESCGSSVSLKCKLPTEDLDVLVSVTSDDDLSNLVAEYLRVSSSTHQDLKIRAILFPLKSIKTVSPSSSSAVFTVDSSSPAAPSYRYDGRVSPMPPPPPTSRFPLSFQRVTGHVRRHPCCGKGSFSQSYSTPRWNHT